MPPFGYATATTTATATHKDKDTQSYPTSFLAAAHKMQGKTHAPQRGQARRGGQRPECVRMLAGQVAGMSPQPCQQVL